MSFRKPTINWHATDQSERQSKQNVEFPDWFSLDWLESMKLPIKPLPPPLPATVQQKKKQNAIYKKSLNFVSKRKISAIKQKTKFKARSKFANKYKIMVRIGCLKFSPHRLPPTDMVLNTHCVNLHLWGIPKKNFPTLTPEASIYSNSPMNLPQSSISPLFALSSSLARLYLGSSTSKCSKPEPLTTKLSTNSPAPTPIMLSSVKNRSKNTETLNIGATTSMPPTETVKSKKKSSNPKKALSKALQNSQGTTSTKCESKTETRSSDQMNSMDQSMPHTCQNCSACAANYKRKTGMNISTLFDLVQQCANQGSGATAFNSLGSDTPVKSNAKYMTYSVLFGDFTDLETYNSVGPEPDTTYLKTKNDKSKMTKANNQYFNELNGMDNRKDGFSQTVCDDEAREAEDVKSENLQQYFRRSDIARKPIREKCRNISTQKDSMSVNENCILPHCKSRNKDDNLIENNYCVSPKNGGLQFNDVHTFERSSSEHLNFMSVSENTSLDTSKAKTIKKRHEHLDKEVLPEEQNASGNSLLNEALSLEQRFKSLGINLNAAEIERLKDTNFPPNTPPASIASIIALSSLLASFGLLLSTSNVSPPLSPLSFSPIQQPLKQAPVTKKISKISPLPTPTMLSSVKNRSKITETLNISATTSMPPTEAVKSKKKSSKPKKALSKALQNSQSSVQIDSIDQSMPHTSQKCSICEKNFANQGTVSDSLDSKTPVKSNEKYKNYSVLFGDFTDLETYNSAGPEPEPTYLKTKNDKSKMTKANNQYFNELNGMDKRKDEFSQTVFDDESIEAEDIKAENHQQYLQWSDIHTKSLKVNYRNTPSEKDSFFESCTPRRCVNESRDDNVAECNDVSPKDGGQPLNAPVDEHTYERYFSEHLNLMPVSETTPLDTSKAQTIKKQHEHLEKEFLQEDQNASGTSLLNEALSLEQRFKSLGINLNAAEIERLKDSNSLPNKPPSIASIIALSSSLASFGLLSSTSNFSPPLSPLSFSPIQQVSKPESLTTKLSTNSPAPTPTMLSSVKNQSKITEALNISKTTSKPSIEFDKTKKKSSKPKKALSKALQNSQGTTSTKCKSKTETQSSDQMDSMDQSMLHTGQKCSICEKNFKRTTGMGTPTLFANQGTISDSLDSKTPVKSNKKYKNYSVLFGDFTDLETYNSVGPEPEPTYLNINNDKSKMTKANNQYFNEFNGMDNRKDGFSQSVFDDEPREAEDVKAENHQQYLQRSDVHTKSFEKDYSSSESCTPRRCVNKSRDDNVAECNDSVTPKDGGQPFNAPVDEHTYERSFSEHLNLMPVSETTPLDTSKAQTIKKQHEHLEKEVLQEDQNASGTSFHDHVHDLERLLELASIKLKACRKESERLEDACWKMINAGKCLETNLDITSINENTECPSLEEEVITSDKTKTSKETHKKQQNLVETEASQQKLCPYKTEIEPESFACSTENCSFNEEASSSLCTKNKTKKTYDFDALKNFEIPSDDFCDRLNTQIKFLCLLKLNESERTILKKVDEILLKDSRLTREEQNLCDREVEHYFIKTNDLSSGVHACNQRSQSLPVKGLENFKTDWKMESHWEGIWQGKYSLKQEEPNEISKIKAKLKHLDTKERISKESSEILLADKVDALHQDENALIKMYKPNKRKRTNSL